MTDLLLDENNDLQWVDGDFVIGDSTAQNQKLLIQCNKASFKENPQRCVGAIRFLEQDTPDKLAREIRQEFAIDGMKVNTIKIDSPTLLEIDAIYKEDIT